MAKIKEFSQLVVEGKDDRHVIWCLCQEHNVPETFTVEVANAHDDQTDGGVEELLNGLPVRLKMAGLRNLGMVIDADDKLQNRWLSIRSRLSQVGYINLPNDPDQNGTIIKQDNMPRVGIWLMPDNRLPGMLEEFVAYLIPSEDKLAPKAEQTLLDIENEGLNKYRSIHHPKAFIHTWLAWQERPGRPMGQSITARVLVADSPLALVFIDWLNRLFAA